MAELRGDRAGEQVVVDCAVADAWRTGEAGRATESLRVRGARASQPVHAAWPHTDGTRPLRAGVHVGSTTPERWGRRRSLARQQPLTTRASWLLGSSPKLLRRERYAKGEQRLPRCVHAAYSTVRAARLPSCEGIEPVSRLLSIALSRTRGARAKRGARLSRSGGGARISASERRVAARGRARRQHHAGEMGQTQGVSRGGCR